MTELNETYDVVVLGGGAAGLNGALMLARSRRSVAVIDAGAPRNAPADGVHGLLAREGMPPLELLERGRAEVRGYGGHVVEGRVVGVERLPDGFTESESVGVGQDSTADGRPVAVAPVSAGSAPEFRVTLEDGRAVNARRILVTTGLADELPEVTGLREQWGHGVLHCPYCHGWEVRDQRIAILAAGPMSVHQALLFSQLSDDIVFLTHTAPALSAEDAEKLVARGISIVDGEVTEVLSTDGALSGVRLADGTVIARDALVVAPRMNTRATFLTDLGLTPEPHPSGMGDHIPADPAGRTAVPGVWIAGNATDPSAQVGAAAAAGAMAGAQINAELVMAETADAVAALRAAATVGVEA
ncbi:oxidoreductase [Nocardia neocaledoniensis NBRC 108232]|uniref:Thioredoxin reductase n=1 Tax=Nocardia neocaledoniensis TaxID=236511 RepID=A0A317NVW1_9NOCA|nr:NAD(P)/FAD-dependent oxidoreductase [Nocardia neocaledoniensis]PWV79439.1 thioredoxin reductase [Nocardia neocaledoniensis]GEM33230.1 oxidoreductase [Nocardia neocaledoniensis NBRC 108232]